MGVPENAATRRLQQRECFPSLNIKNEKREWLPIKNKHRISNMHFFLSLPWIDFLDFYTQLGFRLIKLIGFLQV
jgi:hypothetical protein